MPNLWFSVHENGKQEIHALNCKAWPEAPKRSIKAKWGEESFQMKDKLKQLISMMIPEKNQCICW